MLTEKNREEKILEKHRMKPQFENKWIFKNNMKSGVKQNIYSKHCYAVERSSKQQGA